MVDKEIEQRIYKAVSNSTPDVLDKIYASCDKQKGKVIKVNYTKSNRKRKWLGSLVAAAAIVLIAVSGFAINRWNVSNRVNSRVILDVNPSIQLNVNAKEKVISVEPKNDDGRKILGDMDLKNTDLDVAVNALLGSMLQNGYLSDIQNAILVSVENDDLAKGAQLQEKLTKAIEQILNSNQFESVVFGQTVAADQNIKELSSQYNISEGKAALINELIKQDTRLSFEELALLSVHEIALIMDSKGIETKEVTKTGIASEKAYIGKEQAKAIAYAHAKVDSSKVKLEEIEFDTDDGIILYEIEFKVGNIDYDYEIHAVTGEVIKYSKEVDKDDDKGNKNISDNNKDSSYIGKEKAQAAALSHSKVDESQLTKIEIDFDYDDNKAVYEIEFETKDAEYDYVIDAITGAVLEYERDEKNFSSQDNKSGANPTSNKDYIGKDKAKSIALNHAGVSQEEIKEYEAELDKDDNRLVYDIDFETSDGKYEYEINALTGEVLKSESKDKNKTSNNDNKSRPTKSDSYLGEAKIKEIVFKHAGVDAAKVKDLEIELDGDKDDDDIAIYEMDFKVDRTEYEYEVDAITGKIIKSKVETDD